VQTGDPIYLSIVKDLFVTYNFQLESPAKFKGDGYIDMKATLKGATGWSHVIPLSGTTHFTDTSGRATAVIDLRSITDLVKQANSLTKVPENSYTIAIQPAVRIDGNLGGTKLTKTFSSELSLTGSTTQLKAVAGSGNSTESPVGDKKNPTTTGLNTNSDGTLMVRKGVPATLKTLGVGIGVATLRAIGVAGLLVGLCGLGYTAVQGRRKYSEPVEDLLVEAVNKFSEMASTPSDASEHVDLLVDDEKRVVDVASLSALAEVAHQFDVPMVASGKAGEFVAITDTHLYVFRKQPMTSQERFGLADDNAPKAKK
jgi:hypothetical protein